MAFSIKMDRAGNYWLSVKLCEQGKGEVVYILGLNVKSGVSKGFHLFFTFILYACI